MAIDADIRDQAYQFFIQEAPELLEVIEAELLTLKQERSTAKVHNMMRAAHSIKGGAASVGLETIKTLAHSLEDIFNGLHNQKLEIDAEVESLLLQAYDCLRFPLMEQITTGKFNSDQAMAMAEPVFAQIEAELGEFLKAAANLPSSIELGVDIALSIFEVDVAQGLERLATVLTKPQEHEVAGELRAQAEVFAGLAELLNLPGFGAIAQTAIAALEAYPDQAVQITQLALADFQAGREAVIAGDRTLGGAPSFLETLGQGMEASTLSPSALFGEAEPVEQAIASFVAADDLTAIPSLDDIFGDVLSTEAPALDLSPAISVTPLVEPSAVSPTPSEAKRDASPEAEGTTIPSLDDVFGGFVLNDPAALEPSPAIAVTPSAQPQELNSDLVKTVNAQDSIKATGITTAPTAQLSVRVDLDRLERMNNLVGELTINRNGLSLQNEQLQRTVQELLRRFAKFQEMGRQLRTLSDQMLVAPERYNSWPNGTQGHGGHREPTRSSLPLVPLIPPFSSPLPLFDALEMDSYGELHSLLQGTLEQVVQLEETVGDVVLLAGVSNQTLEQQRERLGHLRDDLMWARMLPLGEVLNRFPRILRDLSRSYDKPVELEVTGNAVLVDKVAIEKLYDPLLHLLRNAFDHGIEPPDVRTQQGKPPQGKIEIRAYHQGSQTIIEITDDGRGINLDRIRSKAVDLGLLSPEQLATTDRSSLLELLFEPGFSTANQVSELSGRGVGLDVVRSQLRSLKGTVTLTSKLGQGTTFTLRIPMTLTIAKLLVCFVGSSAFAFPADSIEEILIPQPAQVKQSGGQRFLHWRDQLVPAYHLSELLDYGCPLPEVVPSLVGAVPSPEDWAPPMLLLSQQHQVIALEIDRLVTEQELVIKPLGGTLAPPSYIYGCTILGDGSLIPVIESAALVNSLMGDNKTAIATKANKPASVNQDSSTSSISALPFQRDIAPTLLVVDDSIVVRQTLALTLQKAGYRVLQARDGREAIDQLGQNSTIQLVVCDIEMPNMNGFEFLSHRRTDPILSKIPTVMLTSRSSDKHRQLAMHLGANRYFTKPYIEQEFLAALKATLKQDASVRVPALAHQS